MGKRHADIIPLMRVPGSWCHKMNDKSAALAVGRVGWGVMQRLAVMYQRPAGRSVNNDRILLIDFIPQIEQGAG